MSPIPSISDAVNVRSIDDLKALFGLVPFMIGDIIVDVIKSVESTYAFDITSKPVEQGFLNDARIAQPMTLNLECIFTNAIENLTIGGAVKSLIAGTFSLDSWKQKRDALLELKNKNIVLAVTTPYKQYKNLMIENLTISESSTLDGLFFNIDLKEVSIKTTATSQVSDEEIPDKLKKEQDKPTEKRKSKKSATGNKPAGGW